MLTSPLFGNGQFPEYFRAFFVIFQRLCYWYFPYFSVTNVNIFQKLVCCENVSLNIIYLIEMASLEKIWPLQHATFTSSSRPHLVSLFENMRIFILYPGLNHLCGTTFLRTPTPMSHWSRTLHHYYCPLPFYASKLKNIEIMTFMFFIHQARILWRWGNPDTLNNIP